MENPIRFIEVDSDELLLTYDTYEQFILYVKKVFNLNTIDDKIIYVKTESDGIYQIEQETYRNLKYYLKRDKSQSDFQKSVCINQNATKSFFRPSTEEYLLKEKFKIGIGYIFKEEFKNNNIGTDLEPKEIQKKIERFCPQQILNKSTLILQQTQEEEKEFLTQKKKEMDEIYENLINNINENTRNKNIYYKTYFEKVLRKKFKEIGLLLKSPEYTNVEENSIKCCFCGDYIKNAFHFQQDENYVVCERCVEIHSDFYPFNFVKNKKKKSEKEN